MRQVPLLTILLLCLAAPQPALVAAAPEEVQAEEVQAEEVQAEEVQAEEVEAADTAADEAAADAKGSQPTAAEQVVEGEAGAEEPGVRPAVFEQAQADEAVAVVRKTLSGAIEVVRGSGTRDDKLIALRSVARDILDTRAMGLVAIGDELAKHPPEQQAEYFELFNHLIVRAYLQKLLLFRNPRFGYGKPRIEGDFVMVGTKIITAKDEYLVDYQMRLSESGWGARDVIVEGISLAQNYREQFASLLRDRTFEELLDLMRRKTRRVVEAAE